MRIGTEQSSSTKILSSEITGLCGRLPALAIFQYMGGSGGEGGGEGGEGGGKGGAGGGGRDGGGGGGGGGDGGDGGLGGDGGGGGGRGGGEYWQNEHLLSLPSEE